MVPQNNISITKWKYIVKIINEVTTLLSKKSIIEENTSAYIINGNWTHYFQKDSVTGDMLALMFPPTGIRMSKLEPNTTYDDLHSRNQIRIFKCAPVTSEDTKLPVYGQQLITLYPDKLYTDGTRLLTVDVKTTKYLDDIDSYMDCDVTMNDVITQELVYIPLSKLHSQYTPKMSVLLYQKLKYGNALEKSYLRAAIKYNNRLEKLANAGEMLTVVNSDIESFIKYINNQFTYGKRTGALGMNIVGDYYINGDDTQYFLRLNEQKTQVVIVETLKSNISDELINEFDTQIPVAEFQELLKRVWFKNSHINYKPEYNYENIWDCYDTIERIVINKIYTHQKSFTNYRFYSVGMQSRYSYYQ